MRRFAFPNSSFVFLFLVLRCFGSPTITNVTDNCSQYPSGLVPRYEKFEITFGVVTTARNLQLPYDSSPPPGVDGNEGISVDALFTPDNWATTYRQPAFYYQGFQYEVKGNTEWMYPTNLFAWKVRFAPTREGSWKYKLVAQDATGSVESSEQSFTVAASNSKGFVRVSKADPRYFEYDNGQYFPALGYNLNYRRVDWINPVLANQENFKVLQQNGIQVIRTWLSQWNIFGSAWNAFKSHNPAHQTQEPEARVRHDKGIEPDIVGSGIARPESEFFLWLSHDETVYDEGKQWDFAPCMILGWETPAIVVKPNTNYRIRVRYKEKDLAGPKVAGKPFGFVVKTGGWLWSDDETERAYYPGTGDLLAATYSTTANWNHYADAEYTGWSILEGSFRTGNQDFLSKLYLAIENATSGHVFVDYVWIEEDLGGNQYGPNLIWKPWFASHKYFDQHNSFAMDLLLDLAKQYDVYFKFVITEKQDYTLCMFNDDGTMVEEIPGSLYYGELFYGNGRTKTKVRWLQQAWWRYLQARWGYSPNIHSWELLNEGNPGNEAHYIHTDELGKYMRQFRPNEHLVTTSFWHSYPVDAFWGNSEYPDVDYADVHLYVHEGDGEFTDAALATQVVSMEWGAKQSYGPRKPVMRGEVGFVFDGTDLFANNVSQGVWNHNYIWGGINAGGLIESYWVGPPSGDHIYKSGSHDHRRMFGEYFRFIKDIPLNNGHYEDAVPTVTGSSDLRVWGQKDVINGKFHIWVQNKQHTWKNVVDGVQLSAISGQIEIAGFTANQSFEVEQWDTWTGQKVKTTNMKADASGTLTLVLSPFQKDIAFRTYEEPSQIQMEPTSNTRIMVPCQPLRLSSLPGVLFLQYGIAHPATVELSVHDLNGRAVASWVKTHSQKGVYEIRWKNQQIARGVYFIRQKVGTQIKMARFLIIH